MTFEVIYENGNKRLFEVGGSYALLEYLLEHNIADDIVKIDLREE